VSGQQVLQRLVFHPHTSISALSRGTAYQSCLSMCWCSHGGAHMGLAFLALQTHKLLLMCHPARLVEHTNTAHHACPSYCTDCSTTGNCPVSLPRQHPYGLLLTVW
jgi:hypothetical protein